MTDDPLYRPLGTGEAPRRSARRWLWLVPAAAVVAAVAVGAVMFRGGQKPGEGVAVAVIETPPPSPPPAPAAPPPGADLTRAAALPAPSDGTTVEIQNGVKVVRFNPASSSSLTSIPVPVAAPSGGVIALRAAPDPRVTETSPRGPLPRLGPGGLRAADVYARSSPARAKGPRLALLLTGMGSDQLATADAARRLPQDATFGFAPDIPDAAAQVAETRRAGHEVVLDLLVPQPPADGGDALAALHRRMAAFAGYAGVIADAAAPATVLRDFTDRGLLLIGAGAAPVGSTAVAPDLVIDAAQGHEAIVAALDRLAGLARSRGTALGVITHASAATADLAAFLGRLDQAGVGLVPVTAMARRAGEVGAAK